MDAVQIAVMGGLGWLLQWAKGPKKFATWIAYGVFGGLAVAAYIWLTPDVASLPWRKAVAEFIAFLLGIEGVTALTRKAGLAPKTDSL